LPPASARPDFAASEDDTDTNEGSTTRQEINMEYALTLLQKFGLFAPKVDTIDAFENRLTRIGTRDSRRDVRASVFVRNPA
jgi:hypothetical protein